MPQAFDLASSVIDIGLPSESGFALSVATNLDSSDGDLSGSIVPYFDDLSQITVTWMGSATNYGAQVVQTYDDGESAYISGSWFGSANQWGANGASLENHDKSQVVSDSAPNIGEGINVGEYNPFPIPAVPPEDPLKERDATRYGKAYSHRRDQPVRIRIYRR